MHNGMYAAVKEGQRIRFSPVVMGSTHTHICYGFIRAVSACIPAASCNIISGYTRMPGGCRVERVPGQAWFLIMPVCMHMRMAGLVPDQSWFQDQCRSVNVKQCLTWSRY